MRLSAVCLKAGQRTAAHQKAKPTDTKTDTGLPPETCPQRSDACFSPVLRQRREDCRPARTGAFLAHDLREIRVVLSCEAVTAFEIAILRVQGQSLREICDKMGPGRAVRLLWLAQKPCPAQKPIQREPNPLRLNGPARPKSRVCILPEI